MLRGARRALPPLHAAALLAAACSGVLDDPAPAGGPLRVVNGAASAVTVVVDGQTRVASLAPGAISPALDVAPSAHQVELRPSSGTGAGSVIAQTASGTATTYVAALGTTAGAVTAVALVDTGAVPAPGTAKLQTIHLAAKAPAIYVWRKQPDFPTPVTFMFPHPYGASTSYVQAPPGTWEVYVTPAGGNPSTSTLAHLTLTIAANQARRVAVLDSANTVRIVPLDAP